MVIKEINRSKHQLPKYPPDSAAGLDLRVNLKNEVISVPFERVMLNSTGTIHFYCKGKGCFFLMNLSNENFVINDSEKICQMVIDKHEKAEWLGVGKLIDTVNRSGEFGQTGIM